MWTWLKGNKRWVFSGFGVPAVVALISLVWRRPRSKTRGVAASDRTEAVGEMQRTPTLPSANDIAITVDKAPPQQRAQVGQNYVGLQVSWPVIVWGVTPLHDGSCSVHFAYGDKIWGAKMRVQINPDDYPRIKTAPAAIDADPKRIVHGWIEGKITEVTSGGGIDLEPTLIEFFN